MNQCALRGKTRNPESLAHSSKHLLKSWNLSTSQVSFAVQIIKNTTATGDAGIILQLNAMVSMWWSLTKETKSSSQQSLTFQRANGTSCQVTMPSQNPWCLLRILHWVSVDNLSSGMEKIWSTTRLGTTTEKSVRRFLYPGVRNYIVFFLDNWSRFSFTQRSLIVDN